MHSLNVKLVVAFLFVSLTGTLMAGAYIWWVTTIEFRQYVVAQNLDDIVNRLGTAYSSDQSWDNLTEWSIIDPFRTRREPADPPPSSAWPRDDSLAVADTSRRVVLPGRGYAAGEIISEEEYEKGEAVIVNGQEVGRLLVNEASRSDQPFDRFMARFYNALGIGSLAATAMALLLGIALARSLTSPLRALTRATQAMSRGDLHQQVRIKSRDEMGELAQSFNRMSADLVEAQDLRRQMTADIAHELRTPLSLILGYAEGLADGVLAPDAETVGIIYDEAQQLARLIDDLRTLSLSDARELSIHRVPVSPRELIDSAVTAHGATAATRRVELRLDCDGELPAVDADPDRVTQVLHNLLSNALRYTPQGGTITLSAHRQGQSIEFAVADSGPGISPEQIGRIFERFYRGDRSRHRTEETSGLGLAIARSLVITHGGKMWVESTLGQGATFYFTLPLATDAA